MNINFSLNLRWTRSGCPKPRNQTSKPLRRKCPKYPRNEPTVARCARAPPAHDFVEQSRCARSLGPLRAISAHAKDSKLARMCNKQARSQRPSRSISLSESSPKRRRSSWTPLVLPDCRRDGAGELKELWVRLVKAVVSNMGSAGLCAALT